MTRIAICHQADAFGRSGWDGADRALAVLFEALAEVDRAD